MSSPIWATNYSDFNNSDDANPSVEAQLRQTIFKVNSTKFSLGDQYLKILLAQCTWAGRRGKRRVFIGARYNILPATYSP